MEQNHRAAEAEPVFRSLLDSYRRILGPEHAETFGAQQGLAHDLMSQGRYQEAADMALPAAQGLSRTAGENDSWTLTAWGLPLYFSFMVQALLNRQRGAMIESFHLPG